MSLLWSRSRAFFKKHPPHSYSFDCARLIEKELPCSCRISLNRSLDLALMSNSLMCEEPSLTIDQQAECAAHAAHKSAGDDDSMSRQRHPRRTSWASPSSNDESPRRLRRLSLPQPLNQELPCSSTLFLTTSFSDDTEVTEVNVDENDFRDVDHSLETWLNGGLCLETDDPPYQFNDNVTETAASASHPLPLEMLPSPSSENIEQLTARQDTIQHSLQNMPPGRNSKHLRLLAMQRRNAILPSCSADDSLLSSEPPNHASAIDQISRSDNSDPSFFVEATLVPDEAKAQGLDVDAHPRPCARPHLVKKQELRVEYPALADIVCTNSTYARSHPGNIYYRQLIAEYVVMINNHQNTDRVSTTRPRIYIGSPIALIIHFLSPTPPLRIVPP